MVSVIINCLNGERFMKDAINSVYNQTYKNWEIIFWDNGSTDNTGKIAKTFDNRLRYFKTNITTALGQARADATKKAKGDYLAFLDVDDYWTEDKLTNQINLFLSGDKNLGFVYGKSDVIYTDVKKKPIVWSEYQKPHVGDVFYKLIRSNFVVFSSLLVDRKKFFACGGFPIKFLNSTDYYVLVRMAKKFNCAYLDEVCCYYRVHNDNLSKKQKATAVLESIKVCTDFLPDKLVSRGLKDRYADLALVYASEMKIINVMKIIILKKCLTNFLILIMNKVYQKIFR